ncbi:N-acetyltransferase [Aneurinibacillus terranovensis]|uniref:N-acetyltransferase n=1 Tax=Aneurinibacillus terranovensis TaxID=278991 RepID=UPI0003FEA372|nr:N-acetyltransferase [Aneurinibacillus terranovensis]
MILNNNQPNGLHDLIFTPSIEVHTQTDDTIVLTIELTGEVTRNGVHQSTEKVGKASLQIVNEEWISGSLLDYLAYSIKNSDPVKQQDLMNVSNALRYIAATPISSKGTIAYLHHLGIVTPFRGRGLTKAYMWLILKMLKEQMEVDTVLLQVHPVGKFSPEELKKEQKRLEKIYTKSGFSVIKSKSAIITDAGLQVKYMYCNLSTKYFTTFK